jgi:dTDP-4-amino-4,6-dideoxygalactose transaminase
MSYNPFEVVDEFEKIIATFAGSKYAVAVESCTSAIFLSCVYVKVGEVTIPNRTYPSVPCSIIHAGGSVKFHDLNWKGIYQLEPYRIYDSALRFRKNMYKGGFHCLSFHNKKLLPIGRGGMILTDNAKAYDWFKKARFDGRNEVPLEEDTIGMLGWNCYLTPEQAVRGIQLFSTIDQKRSKDLDSTKQGYQDLSRSNIYERK